MVDILAFWVPQWVRVTTAQLCSTAALLTHQRMGKVHPNETFRMATEI